MVALLWLACNDHPWIRQLMLFDNGAILTSIAFCAHGASRASWASVTKFLWRVLRALALNLCITEGYLVSWASLNIPRWCLIGALNLLSCLNNLLFVRSHNFFYLLGLFHRANKSLACRNFGVWNFYLLCCKHNNVLLLASVEVFCIQILMGRLTGKISLGHLRYFIISTTGWSGLLWLVKSSFDLVVLDLVGAFAFRKLFLRAVLASDCRLGSIFIALSLITRQRLNLLLYKRIHAQDRKRVLVQHRRYSIFWLVCIADMLWNPSDARAAAAQTLTLKRFANLSLLFVAVAALPSSDLNQPRLRVHHAWLMVAWACML